MEHKEEIQEKAKLYRKEHREELKKKNAQWRIDNREYISEKQKEWFKSHRDEQLIKMRTRYEENKETNRQRSKEYRKTHRQKLVEYSKKYYYESGVRESRYLDYLLLKQKAFESLGNKCCKCGFTDHRALQIDHINGGGNKEISSIKTHGVYKKVIVNPEKYQLLCANCNWIKRYEDRELTYHKLVNQGELTCTKVTQRPELKESLLTQLDQGPD
jgi:hypothetical protein